LLLINRYTAGYFSAVTYHDCVDKQNTDIQALWTMIHKCTPVKHLKQLNCKTKWSCWSSTFKWMVLYCIFVCYFLFLTISNSTYLSLSFYGEPLSGVTIHFITEPSLLVMNKLNQLMPLYGYFLCSRYYWFPQVVKTIIVIIIKTPSIQNIDIY